MTGYLYSPRRSLFLPLGLLALYFAAGCGESASNGEPDYPTWTARPEFRFNSDHDRDVSLSQVPYLRVDPVRNRVFVIDLLGQPVTAWTPEGSVVFSARRGEGPGEFNYPTRIYLGEDGSFAVRESFGTRFAWFTPDGELARTVPGAPPSMTYDGSALNWEAPVYDGGFLGIQRISAATALGLRDRSAINAQPLLRLRPPEQGVWPAPYPVFQVNTRNRRGAVQRGQRTSFIGQPFGDEDLWRIHPGGAVVARRNGAPGVVDLFELDADGDTLWRQSLSLPPLQLTAERVEQAIQSWVASRARSRAESPATLGEAYRRVLYQPEYLPAIEEMFLSASGEVWLGTHERSDDLRVFYAVSREHPAGQPRRILLPDGVRFHDATDTHVWGIHPDRFDVPHIVGLRLLPQ